MKQIILRRLDLMQLLLLLGLLLLLFLELLLLLLLLGLLWLLLWQPLLLLVSAMQQNCYFVSFNKKRNNNNIIVNLRGFIWRYILLSKHCSQVFNRVAAVESPAIEWPENTWCLRFRHWCCRQRRIQHRATAIANNKI